MAEMLDPLQLAYYLQYYVAQGVFLFLRYSFYFVLMGDMKAVISPVRKNGPFITSGRRKRNN